MVEKLRRIIQITAALLMNANFTGFATGQIFKGSSKQFCVPGLNCYSCPGAVGSCPIGSLQSMAGNPSMRISLYVSGFLILIGAFFGRLICGFICPFGLLQELIYKLPTKKLKLNKRFSFLRYIKYIVLIIFVFVLPAFFLWKDGVGVPAFCKFICPAGTLEAGIPLVLLDERLRQTIGGLFWWKIGVLCAVSSLCIFMYRAFCRFLCPLGAVYGLLNRFSLFGVQYEKSRCNRCGHCNSSCKMELKPTCDTRSAECIGCGDCVKGCSQKALYYGNSIKKETVKK